jgi:hypothetical protein
MSVPRDEPASKAAALQQVYLVSFVLMGIAAAVAVSFDQRLVAAVLGAGAIFDLLCMWMVRRSS